MNFVDLHCDLPVFNQSELAEKDIIVFALLRAKHPHNLIKKRERIGIIVPLLADFLVLL